LKALYTYKNFFIVFALFLISQKIAAQGTQNRLLQTNERIKNAEDFSRKLDSNYKKSIRIAGERGLKIKSDLGNGRFLSLQEINEIGEPLYIINHSNTQAAATTKTNQLYSGGSLGISLSGKSDTMSGRLAIWDGGNALATHQEFGGRIKLQENLSTTDIHGTHVAGTMIASGVNSNAKGMSFGADLKLWDYNNDNAEISDASIPKTGPPLLVSNHSYGYQAGWVYDSTKNKWQWWGEDQVSTYEDYKFGFYNGNAQTLDKIAFNAPNYLIVKSAGNSRDANGPEAGKYYFLKTSTKDSSNIARSKNDGYDIISTTGTAKNILTVGAAESMYTIPEKGSDVTLASFSSWGPTDDGRIKPDIVGIGTDLLSTSNASTTSYTYLSGTSMATPQVSGSIFLLQQLYNRLNTNTFMRAATLKGVILHTAMDMAAVGPDYQTGWGLLDMEKAAKVILNVETSNLISEGTLANSAIDKRSFVASGKGDLVATISWTDPESTVYPINTENLNNRKPKLVNDLDIKISDGAGKFLPFILDPAAPEKIAEAGDNIRDNIEKIIIKGAVPGKSYELSISHKGTLKDNKSQDFSLIVSGIGGKAYCAITPTSPQNLIKSLAVGTYSNTVSTSQDFTSTPIPLELGGSSDLILTFSNTASKKIKVVVDWNQDGDFEDLNEVMLASDLLSTESYSAKFKVPSNLSINQYFRMRVVSELGNSSTNVCGNLGTGESEEYVIQVIQASNDMGVLSISNPVISYCATNGPTSLSVRVKNYGSKSQSNVPVTLNYYLDNLLQGSLNGKVLKIDAGVEQIITVTGNANWVAGKTYKLKAISSLDVDQNTNNDLLSVNQSIENPQAPVGTGLFCSGASTLNLSASQGYPLWYSNNVLVASGTTATAPNSTNFTVGSNDFSGSMKPLTKKDFGSGSYFENFGPAPIFDIKVPIVLQSARVYVGTSGTITFDVFNYESGELISSVTKDLTATRTQTNSTKVNNQLTDDKNDPGQVVELNLSFPKPGTYILAQSCSNGATIFRSNKSLSDTVNTPTNLGYPYTIPSILSMTGALFNGAPITSGYYYFYDMKFKSLGCPSPRATVNITTSKTPEVSINPVGSQTICLLGSLLITAKSPDNPSYQWLLNGAAISGANSATYNANKTGAYQVKSTIGGLCSSTSSTLNLTISNPLPPVITYLDGTMKIAGTGTIQWYVNGAIIPGATTSSFIPVQSGLYSVFLKDVNGCSATSDLLTINILAAEKENPFSVYVAFPNPAVDLLNVGLPQALAGTYTIEIIDIHGRIFLTEKVNLEPGVNQLKIDISKIPVGTYVVRLPEILSQPSMKFIKN
jgi:hypothetical protein